MDLKMTWMFIVILFGARLAQAGDSPLPAQHWQQVGDAPAFAAAEMQAEIAEDAAPGTFVADVAPPGSKRGGAVRYQVVSGDELGAFSLDAATGRLTVAGKLDYEARQQYELQLGATAAAGGLPVGQARLVVRVADANDLPPVFRSAVYHAELQEEEDPARLPLTLLTVEAVDGDSGRPQALVYSLSGPGVAPDGSGHFSIDARTGDVFVLKPLDRDPPLGRPLWRLAAFAQDEAGAGLVGHAEVRVALRDVNDNAPAFPRRLYRGRVVENAPAGTVVLNVTAVDNDDPYEGLNARITYSIEKNVVDEASGSAIFAIDGDSGQIRTAVCCLDRERTPRYAIQVVATDGGGLQGTTTVSIAVKDVNDTPPEFSKDEWLVEVDETGAGGLPQRPILTVTARDRDEDSAFQYAVVGGSGYGADRFTLVTNSDGTGSLKVVKPLDYEDVHRNVLRFKIQVTDKRDSNASEPYHTAYSWVTVKVRDVNDNAPEFARHMAEVAVMEDARAGTKVAHFKATDRDGGGAAPVSYRVAADSDPGGHFAINEGGELLIRRPLDREQSPRHKVHILAVDDGSPPKTSTATITVFVQDVNDNAPQMLHNYQPVLPENSPPTEITEIYAKDADDYSRHNGPPFLFRIDPTADEITKSSFRIDFNKNGDGGNGSAIISSLRTFDREEKREYLVPILVIDSGYPPLTGTATVKITIGDVNDNLMKPGKKMVLVYKHQDQTPETDIGRIHIEDPDDWDLPDKKFYWAKYQQHQRFRIDEDTGMVTMRSDTPEGKYTLVFRVSDRRHSQNNVSAIMVVTVKQLPHSSVRNSGSIRISGISAEDFIREWQYMGTQMSKAQLLTNVLAEILGIEERNVEIFSIMQQGEQPPLLDIFFSVEDPKLQRRETITGLLQVHREEITRKIGLKIVVIGINHCMAHDIKCEGACLNNYKPSKHSILVDANTTSFVGISVIVTPECQDITIESTYKSCRDHHCYNGGCCVQKGQSVSCACPTGFDGPRCQGTVRSFQGDGWAWFPSLIPQSENHLSLEFLTKEEHGLIFYNGPVSLIVPVEDSASDFVAFEIYNGKPRLLLKTIHGSVELSTHMEINLNDGKWHHIDIFWNYVNVRLIVDFCKSADVVEMKEAPVVFFNGSSCQAERSLPFLKTQLNLNSPLQIGGIYWSQIPAKPVEWHLFPKSSNFDGCIRNFFHNSQIVDLADPLLSVGTAVGCSHTKAACSQLNCTAHGTCLADLTGAAPQCWCDVGWGGSSCSVPTKPITFRAHSYIKFALSFELSHFATVMQLRFRTEEVEGELFRLSDQVSQEYAILEIVNGSLCFRYNLNSIHTEEHSVCLSYVNISDGNWHTAKISRYGSLSVLQLDDGEFTRYNQTTSFEGHQLLVVDKQEGVHAGGKAEYLGMNTLEIFADYKNGCVDDIRLDGRVLPLPPSLNVTQWGQATAALNVEHGCGYSDCSTAFCQEPLIYASEILNKHHCMCGGESRTLKPESDICSSSDSGKCLYQQSKHNYKCICPDEAEGIRHGFLQERHTFSLGVWILIVLLSSAVLFFVLGAMFIGYKYQCSVHEVTEVKNDVQENVIFHADEGGGKDAAVSCSMKELKVFVDKIGPTESVEMHKLSELQKNSEEKLKNMIEEHKREIDTKILSDNLDHTCCYDFEGSAEPSSSLSSLTTEYEIKEQNYKDITKITQEVHRV